MKGYLVLGFALLICLSSINAVADVLEFSGVPVVKITTSPESTSKVQLTSDEMAENRVVINKDDEGNYIWATRNNTLLFKTVSGIYTIYTSFAGAGYVKVDNTTGMFMEHVHMGFMTITYHGMETGLSK